MHLPVMTHSFPTRRSSDLQGPFDFHLRTESAAQQRPALVDTGVHRRVGGMQRLAPGKGQQAMCQLRPAQRGTQCGFDLLTERRASFGIVENKIQVSYDGGEQVVEVMRDTAGELADSLHLLRLDRKST